jgi:hypothetical protein
LDVVGDWALVPDAEGDLVIYGLGGGTNAGVLWTHTDAGVADRVVARGRYAYVAGGAEGMLMVDLAAVSPFTFIARAVYDTKGACVDVAVQDNVVFVADAGLGVVIVNVTDANWSQYAFTIPLQKVSEIKLTGVRGVDVVNDRLYVAASGSGLLIYDVQDLLNPVWLGTRTTGSDAERVRVVGSQAYVICSGGRVEVLDVSNPAAPVLRSSYEAGGHVTDLDLTGSRLFLANTNGQVSEVSVANPVNPILVTNHLVDSGVLGVRAIGARAYVRPAPGGFVILETAGTVSAPPKIIRPIQDVTGILGLEAVLGVDVEGSPPMMFRWDKENQAVTNGSRITGATDRLLKITGLLGSDVGTYRLQVTNIHGQVTSSNISLSLVPVGTPLLRSTIEISGGDVRAVDLDQRYAYVAAGGADLKIVDIGNPSFPFQVAGLTDSETVLDVAVFDGLAFLAAGSGGLRILNVENIPNVALVGSLDTPGNAQGLWVTGPHVFIADGEAGLRIVDVRDPASPVAVGQWDTPGDAVSVFCLAGRAYVADGDAGVHVLDVSVPVSPAWVGTYDTAGTACQVEVIGDIAYVADGVNGLLVLDLNNPASPVLLGQYPVEDAALGLRVVGTTVWLAAGTDGLQVLDASDPANPVLVATGLLPGEASAIELRGNVACVGCGPAGISLVSLAGVASTFPSINTISPDQYLLPGQSAAISVTASGQAPLQYQWYRGTDVVFDGTGVTGSATATLQLSEVDLGDSSSYSVVVRNAWNLSVAASTRVYVVPVGAPVPRARVGLGNDMLDVRVAGQRAYAISRQQGLDAFDFSTPSAPVLLDSEPSLGQPQQICLRGHLAWVASGDAGLEIFDLAIATNLVRVAQLPTGGRARGLDVAEGFAYVADQISGLNVIDVRNPVRPLLLATVPTRAPAVGVLWDAGRVCVAVSGAGLQVFDVTDPLGPREVGWLDTAGEAESVALAGPIAYVADYDGGLNWVDLTSPTSPVSVGVTSFVGDVFQARLFGSRLYLAAGTEGLQMLDISDPLNPVVAGFGGVGTFTHGLAVQGKHALLADRDSGLIVTEFLGSPAQPPVIAESPADLVVAEGSMGVLSAGVWGTPPFVYEWYKDGAPLNPDASIDGVTEPHLKLRTVTTNHAGAYFAVIGSPYGAVTSAVASVTVASGSNSVPPAFTLQPVSQVSTGGPAMFSAQVSGIPAPALRWYHNGQPLFDGTNHSGATTPSLVISNVSLVSAGAYSLKAWNAVGLTNSLPATLTHVGLLQSLVNNAPSGSTLPLSNAVYAEALRIDKDLTLVGNGAGTVLDGLGLGTPLTILDGAEVTVVGVALRRGWPGSNGFGGAISNAGRLTLQGTALLDNQAPHGAAAANFGELILLDCLVSNNLASGQGGGVFNGPQAVLRMMDSTFCSNRASEGGGLYNLGQFFITNSTLMGNVAAGAFQSPDGFGVGQGRGGGVYSLGGMGVFENSTLSGNHASVPPLSAGGEGGGLHSASATIDCRFATVAFNTASNAGGGLQADSGSSLHVQNSIIGSNFRRDGPSDVQGALASLEFSLIQSTNGLTLPPEAANNVLGTDPLLEPLQDNGGATLTHAPRSGSPALDAASEQGLPSDQRGVPRPFDIPNAPNRASGEDIGSVEYIGTAPQFARPPDQVLVEDEQRSLPLLVEDAETPDQLAFEADSSNATLIPANRVTVHSQGTNHTLTLHPQPDQFGTATVHLVVIDADGFTNATAFELRVLPLNDPPRVLGLSNVVGALDAAAYVVPFSVYDLDGPGPADSISVTATAANSNLIFGPGITVSGTGSNRVLTLPHVADQSGVAQIQLTISDGLDSAVYHTLVSVAPNPIPLSLEVGTDGVYWLSWQADGMLQHAPTVTGAWTSLSASSPLAMNIQAGITSEFFRVINPVTLYSFPRDPSNLTLAWPGAGVLQSAPTPVGPWQTLSTSGPFDIQIRSGITSEFFRVTSP